MCKHASTRPCIRAWIRFRGRAALQGVVGIPQAVAFLPTFRGVKMCPRRAGRVGNCFAPSYPCPRPPFQVWKKAMALSRFSHFSFFFSFHLSFFFAIRSLFPRFRGRLGRGSKWKTRARFAYELYESAFSPIRVAAFEILALCVDSSFFFSFFLIENTPLWD